MSGKRGGARPGAGRPSKGPILHGSTSNSPQLFSGPSLTVPGISGTSGAISPFFGAPESASAHDTHHESLDLHRSAVSTFGQQIPTGAPAKI